MQTKEVLNKKWTSNQRGFLLQNDQQRNNTSYANEVNVVQHFRAP